MSRNIMKKFIILDDDDPYYIFWKSNKNTLYKLINNQIYIKLNNKQLISVKIEYLCLELDYQLLIHLNDIAIIAIREAAKLSNEPIELRMNSVDEINTMIFSTIQKFSFEENKKIFDFLTHLFVKCLTEHKLINGNKRFSLTFLILLLSSFGYSFNWITHNEHDDYSRHENKISNFVEQLENNKFQTESNKQMVIKNIKKWIISNTKVSIPRTKIQGNKVL